MFVKVIDNEDIHHEVINYFMGLNSITKPSDNNIKKVSLEILMQEGSVFLGINDLLTKLISFNIPIDELNKIGVKVNESFVRNNTITNIIFISFDKIRKIEKLLAQASFDYMIDSFAREAIFYMERNGYRFDAGCKFKIRTTHFYSEIKFSLIPSEMNAKPNIFSIFVSKGMGDDSFGENPDGAPNDAIKNSIIGEMYYPNRVCVGNIFKRNYTFRNGTPILKGAL